MPRQFKVLDLSGYMFSGKAAVHDFISEIDGFYSPGNRAEFDLLRVKDGIADLESAITSWSPIRSDEAARRFLKLVHKMGQIPSGMRRFTAPGFGYFLRYPKLSELSQQFIDSITVSQWGMYWPYHLLDMNGMELFLYKIKRKLFDVQNNIQYRLISSENFYPALRNFLAELLSHNISDKSLHSIVLNNAFEPFDPARFINYFHDAKCIVVDRDPRDIFTVANQFSRGFNDQVKLYRNIAGAHDVDIFINRIKVYRSQILPTSSSRILRLNFEDLVLKYDETASRIYSFLGVDPSEHSNKFKFFNPDISKKNVNIWKQFKDQNAVRKIGLELCDDQ